MEPREAEGPGGHSHNPKVQEGCGALGLGTTWAGSAEVLGQAGLRLPNEGCP